MNGRLAPPLFVGNVLESGPVTRRGSCPVERPDGQTIVASVLVPAHGLEATESSECAVSLDVVYLWEWAAEWQYTTAALPLACPGDNGFAIGMAEFRPHRPFAKEDSRPTHRGGRYVHLCVVSS
jgi:hypothetical protein